MKPLNTREVKKIKKLIKEQYGCELKEKYHFFLTKKNKIYISTADLIDFDLKKIRVNNIGMYFAALYENQIRPSPEGAQLIPAKKNLVNLDEEQAKKYLQGLDINLETEDKPYVIVRYNKDTLGTAKPKNNKLLNYLPKEYRRKTIILN